MLTVNISNELSYAVIFNALAVVCIGVSLALTAACELGALYFFITVC